MTKKLWNIGHSFFVIFYGNTGQERVCDDFAGTDQFGIKFGTPKKEEEKTSSFLGIALSL